MLSVTDFMHQILSMLMFWVAKRLVERQYPSYVGQNKLAGFHREHWST